MKEYTFRINDDESVEFIDGFSKSEDHDSEEYDHLVVLTLCLMHILSTMSRCGYEEAINVFAEQAISYGADMTAKRREKE
jgi:hypothetical protein